MGWADMAAIAQAAERAAHAAILADNDDAWAHYALGCTSLFARRFDDSLAELELALRLNPNFSLVQGYYGLALAYCGRWQDGDVAARRALRLSPRDPNITWWQFYICHLHTHLAQWGQAIEWCGKSIASGNANMYPYVDLAAANAWAGHDKQAKEAVAQLRKLTSPCRAWPASIGVTIRPA